MRKYWIERMAETSELARKAGSPKHRDVYLRLVETYATLAGCKPSSANDNRRPCSTRQ